MNKKWYLLETLNEDGYSNMALDEAMLLFSKKRDIALFRLYRWSSPTISLGRFNKYLDINNIDIVRRITGGGLILHHNEFSYSVAMPRDFLKDKSVKGGYLEITSFLNIFYNSLGLKSNFAFEQSYTKSSKNPSCFNSFEPYDILINSKKIGGNAQRVDKESLFQHGAVPLNIDYSLYDKYLLDDLKPSKDKICDIKEFVPEIDYSFVEKKLILSFQKNMKIEFLELNKVLKDELNDIKQDLLKNKYNTKNWNIYANKKKT